MRDRLTYLQPPEWLENNDRDGFLTPLEQEISFHGSGSSISRPPERYGLQKEVNRQYIDELPPRNLHRASESFHRVSLPSRQTLPFRFEPGGPRDDPSHGRADFLSSSSSGCPISSPTIPTSRNRQLRNNQLGQVRRNENPQTPKNKIIKPTATSMPYKTNEAILSLPHAPPIIQGIQLVETVRLPDNMRSLFSFPLFNAVQSKCFPHAYEGDDNIVLSAPTGSGKTVIMELSICRLLATQERRDFKVIYQAPTRSLCNERFRDWSNKFRSLGLDCAELTGDIEFANLRNAQKAHVIITTPEKWDSVTRKWKDNAKLMQMIKLFLIDEVHMLNETRGATLEAVVSRMKSVGVGVRFIALSATVPNSEDIATWLGLNSNQQSQPAIREVFGEAFRPVALEKHVIGFQGPANDFALDSMLVKEVPGVIARYGKRKPVMIFCPTKKASATQAIKLAELWMSTAPHARLWNSPNQQVKVIDEDLKKIVAAGVAFHHSGLDVSDRQAVENGFLHGNISIICSTSTLAVGVNLPCYLVILKGTVCYTDNGLQEYSSLEVMQMLGRAGRPQFETSACAVIMTNQYKIQQYEKMVSGTELLESCLHQNLIEHLNAEIGTGTVRDLASAKKWLSGTFLNVRVRRNPQHYRLKAGGNIHKEDSLLEDLCERDAALLKDAKLVKDTDVGFRSTDFGEIMARYYVRYESMKSLMALSPKAKMSDILQAIANAEEFKDLRWRVGEKNFYKQINKANDIRYPIKVDVALPAHKASIVAQIRLGGITFDKESAKKYSMSFNQDALMVLSHYNRLIRCVIDTFIAREDSVAVRNALELARSLAAGVWDNTPMQLKQISGVGEITARRLASAGINSIDTLLNTEPHRVELVMGKAQPYGNDLLKKLVAFPNLRITVKEVDRKYKANKGVELSMRCEIGYINDRLPEYFNQKAVYVIFLCESSYGKLIEFRRFSIKRLTNGEDILLKTFLDRPTTHLNCHVSCDEIAGTHRCAELKLDLPASVFPAADCQKDSSCRALNFDLSDSDKRIDEFDDTDLNDDDFLAAEAGLEDIEVVTEDIEKLLAQGQKRKADSTIPKSSNASDWREPKRLKNGNWSCQHTCNDDGKECHHQCCKEGVKKPRRRPKSASQVVTKSKHISANKTTKQNRTSSGGEVTAKKSISEILKNATGHKREDANSDRKKDILLLSESEIDNARLHSSRLIADPNDLVVEAKSSTAWSSTVGKQPVDKKSGSAQSSSEFDLLADTEIYDICDIDLEDCDWDLGTTAIEDILRTTVDNDSESKQEQSRTTQTTLSLEGIVTTDTDYLAKVNKTLPGSEEDILSQKLFFSEVNTSPHKSASTLPTSQVEAHKSLPHEEGSGDTGSWTEIDQLDFDLPHEAVERTKKVEHSDTSTALQDDMKDTNTEDVCEVSSVLADAVMETEEQLKKRLYEEDQKKKWEGLDPKLYEQFSHLVELI